MIFHRLRLTSDRLRISRSLNDLCTYPKLHGISGASALDSSSSVHLSGGSATSNSDYSRLLCPPVDSSGSRNRAHRMAARQTMTSMLYACFTHSASRLFSCGLPRRRRASLSRLPSYMHLSSVDVPRARQNDLSCTVALGHRDSPRVRFHRVSLRDSELREMYPFRFRSRIYVHRKSARFSFAHIGMLFFSMPDLGPSNRVYVTNLHLVPTSTQRLTQTIASANSNLQWYAEKFFTRKSLTVPTVVWPPFRPISACSDARPARIRRGSTISDRSDPPRSSTCPFHGMLNTGSPCHHCSCSFGPHKCLPPSSPKRSVEFSGISTTESDLIIGPSAVQLSVPPSLTIHRSCSTPARKFHVAVKRPQHLPLTGRISPFSNSFSWICNRGSADFHSFGLPCNLCQHNVTEREESTPRVIEQFISNHSIPIDPSGFTLHVPDHFPRDSDAMTYAGKKIVGCTHLRSRPSLEISVESSVVRRVHSCCFSVSPWVSPRSGLRFRHVLLSFWFSPFFCWIFVIWMSTVSVYVCSHSCHIICVWW